MRNPLKRPRRYNMAKAMPGLLLSCEKEHIARLFPVKVDQNSQEFVKCCRCVKKHVGQLYSNVTEPIVEFLKEKGYFLPSMLKKMSRRHQIP